MRATFCKAGRRCGAQADIFRRIGFDQQLGKTSFDRFQDGVFPAAFPVERYGDAGVELAVPMRVQPHRLKDI